MLSAATPRNLTNILDSRPAEPALAMNAEIRMAHEPIAQSLTSAIVRLATVASTEIAPHDERLLRELGQHLPPGTSVYVAHTPNASFEDVLRVATEVHSRGWTAWPHLVARRLPSERALRDALGELRARGISQALLVAGDRERPAGPFASTLEMIDSGALDDGALSRIGVAGHPEGLRSVDPDELMTALRRKQEFASRTGVEVHIVTQFGFDLEVVRAWAHRLRSKDISLPIHVGIAGPTPLPKLIRFAIQCGVRHSVGALAGRLSAFSQLAAQPATADQLLLGLAREHFAASGPLLLQPHFFSFGGAVPTASWLGAIRRGEFGIHPDGKRLEVNR